MVYNLGNPLDAKTAQLRLAALSSRGAIIEMTERRPKRTQKQNNYLHSCLAFAASQLGVSVDYCKQRYFKQLCNPGLFIQWVKDPRLGAVMELRSTSDLSTAELSAATERFRDWCATEGGIYIPSPDEPDLINLMEAQTCKEQRWI